MARCGLRKALRPGRAAGRGCSGGWWQTKAQLMHLDLDHSRHQPAEHGAQIPCLGKFLRRVAAVSFASISAPLGTDDLAFSWPWPSIAHDRRRGGSAKLARPDSALA